MQATSASIGLDRLSGQMFDCVISDYDMADCTGIEFLNEVREGCSELPFILFTGKGTEEVASDAISAGVTDYLQKQASTDHYTVLANPSTSFVEYFSHLHGWFDIKAYPTYNGGIAFYFSKVPKPLDCTRATE